VPPIGAGANLHLGFFYHSIVRSGITAFSSSAFATSSDTFSYPAPTFLNNTIALVSSPVFSTNLRLLNTFSQSIRMNGTNFCNDETAAKLYYGPEQNPFQFICEINPTLTTASTLFCDTADFSQGTDLIFTYVAMNQISNGTDKISYPSAATIQYARGCAGTSGDKTINCDTAGGQTLTLHGLDFKSPIAVFVNGQPCETATVISQTEVTCQMPPGTGADRSVFVNSDNIFSRPVVLVSYGAPVIDTISGCSYASVTKTVDCPRTGNTTIVLTGRNFGVGGTILIGSLPCTNPSITHTSASCNVPAGNRLDVSVLLIQYNGETSSSSSISLSYTQCDKGTYENGTACPACEKGTYSQFKGLTTCSDCDEGKFASNIGAQSCDPCPLGSWSAKGQSRCYNCSAGFMSAGTPCQACLPGLRLLFLYPFFFFRFIMSYNFSFAPITGSYAINGSSVCIDCPLGTFSGQAASTCSQCAKGSFNNVQGRQECFGCPVGKFGNVTGSSFCYDCPPGFAQPSTGQTACVQCNPGYYNVLAGRGGLSFLDLFLLLLLRVVIPSCYFHLFCSFVLSSSFP
jgi:hypothetical protein